MFYSNASLFRSSRKNRSSRRSSRGSTTSLPTLGDVRLESPEDVSQLIASLRKERSRLLQEIEQEDEVRSAFYSHLDSLNQRLRALPHQYNVSTSHFLSVCRGDCVCEGAYFAPPSDRFKGDLFCLLGKGSFRVT